MDDPQSVTGLDPSGLCNCAIYKLTLTWAERQLNFAQRNAECFVGRKGDWAREVEAARKDFELKLRALEDQITTNLHCGSFHMED